MHDNTDDAYTVICYDELGNLELTEPITYFTTGAILNNTLTDEYDFCYEHVFKTKALHTDGVSAWEHDIIVTPSFSFWVSSVGAYTNDLSVYGDDWHGGSCPSNFGLSWIDKNDYPDLFATTNDYLYTYMDVDSAETYISPTFESVSISNTDDASGTNKACINTSFKFRIRMEDVPDDNYDFRINYNNTYWTLNYTDVSQKDSDYFFIDPDEDSAYLQTSGVKSVWIQARNSLYTTEETGIWQHEYWLYPRDECVLGEAPTNTTSSDLLPRILNIGKTPANPVLSNTEVEWNFEILDQEGGEQTLKYFHDIRGIEKSTATFNVTSEEVYAEQLLNHTYVVDSDGTFLYWAVFEVYESDSIFVNKNTNILPDDAIAELLEITPQEVINNDWTIPEYIEDRRYVRAFPVLVCGANSSCYGQVPKTSGNDQINELGVPTEPSSSGVDSENDSINKAFNDLKDWTGLTKTTLWLILMCFVGVILWVQSGEKAPTVTMGVIAGLELLLLIIGFKIGMLSNALIITISIIALAILGVFMRKIFFGGD